ncbi:hypothetical protein BCR33DRAFT_715283 [Rhizoclosmatium globosum]|uniref:Phorbol-ester/DAG-type domain-containing protein n=1 Tax=Rhizoclosmatium globosum TaxID=329046 RepID=A0A1Y2CIJ6_9FUNG|nr:hypothetical protein BCR33DRAFT_715283 [Rhizoclosmatium globosum]|eukprot:ORY46870.1 hypothetical protein BCR33DRAFT_715283 [Rhizoclosmatium globosum]
MSSPSTHAPPTQPPPPPSHVFVAHNYTAPTYCHHCDGFLWGLVAQGLKCSTCGLDVHVACRDSLAKECRSRARTLSNRGSVDLPPQPPPQPQPSLIDDFVAQAHISSLSRERSRKASNPPLDLVYTTPKNMVGFVTRLTPIVIVFEVTTDILTWKDVPTSMLALIVSIALCFYPHILTIVPHGCILYIVVSSYFEKAKYELALKNKPQASASTSEGSVAAPADATTATTSTTPLVYSATYLRNLQFIQNQMGLFVNGYDAVESGLRQLQLYSDQHPFQCIDCVLCSLRFICLGAVLLAFSINTIFFQAFITTIPTALLKNLLTRVDVIREGIQAASAAPGGSIVVVTIWENQRWWAGLGWIPHLFRSERAPWSDETGNITRPSKESYALPPPSNGVGSWSWVDLEWTLDFDWAIAGVDQKEGWQYSDHAWENGRAKCGVGSVTRRRAWMRRMRFIPNLGVSVVASMLPKSGIAAAVASPTLSKKDE